MALEGIRRIIGNIHPHWQDFQKQTENSGLEIRRLGRAVHNSSLSLNPQFAIRMGNKSAMRSTNGPVNPNSEIPACPAGRRNPKSK